MSRGSHINMPHYFKTKGNIVPLDHFSSYVLAFTIQRRAREENECTQLGVGLLAEGKK